MNRKRNNQDVLNWVKFALVIFVFFGPRIIRGTKKMMKKMRYYTKMKYRAIKFKIYDRRQMQKEINELNLIWNIRDIWNKHI